jgi:hypothetical protein
LQSFWYVRVRRTEIGVNKLFYYLSQDTMPTTDEYRIKIRRNQRRGLLRLWNGILNGNTPGWGDGKAFEFLVLRAFELEGATIRWPYSVDIAGLNVEQIDGAIHFEDINFSILAEFKDSSKTLNIEPVSKLRNQLLRRPAGAIGSIFTTNGFSEASLLLAQFISPQTILLWERDNIEFCLRRGEFRDGLLKKYRHTIETGDPTLDLTI